MGRSAKHSAQQAKLILEELEERRLFSGGIEGLIDTSLDSDVNALFRDIDGSGTQSGPTTADTAAAEQQTREVAFVDAGADNYQQLVDDLLANADSSRNIEVVVLDRDKDGIEQISAFLSQRDDLDAVHIISHGDDGNIQLGNTNLNEETLEDNNLKIALWANAFAETGDILIYGCNLAETEAGQSLIDDISSLTLADVAASTDLTGHASLGGDWEMEHSVGKIETEIALSESAQQAWEDVLAPNTPPVNSVPIAQVTAVDAPIVFSGTEKFSVSDTESESSPLEITLDATNGTLTLSGTTGLSFSSGNGTSDTTMIFQGTIADINTALDGLIFTPGTGYSGAASIQMTSNDLGISPVGNTTTFGSSTSTGTYDKEQIATQVSVTADGTATSISVYLANNKANTVAYGIYSDVAGEPGALLVEGTVAVPIDAVGDWYTIDISDVALTAGDYWIAMDIGKESMFFYDTSGGNTRFSNYDPASGFSNPNWTGTYDSNTWSISAFINYIEDGAAGLTDIDTVNINVGTNSAPTFIEGAFGNWSFDEGSGDSVAEGAVGVSTATLGSTTGADANDPTWTSGIFGQALQFDGVNDYVEVADAPGIDISGPEFSASLWVKPDRGPGTEDMFFMKGDRQGTGNVNYYLSWKDTGKMTWAFKSDGGFEYIDIDVTLPTVDEWNHIAVVFDRPTVSIYINGTEYTSSVATGGTMDKDLVANDDPLWIGAGRDGGSLVTAGNFSAPFSGAIDELALFDRALTAAEVEAIRISAPPVVTASAFTVDENSANNTVVGTVVANDPDLGDTLTYAITAGNTNGAFAIDNNGVITVANSAALDFETTPVFSLIVEATDDGSPNLSDSTSVTISLNEVNEAPTDILVGSTINGGLNLNNDGGNDTYLVADSGLSTAVSQFTFETQFQGSNGSTEVPFISYNTASGDVLSINTMSDNTLELDIGTGTEVFSSAIDYNAVLMDGERHTLSVSWDNTAGDWAIYIDGALIDSGTGLSTGQTIPTGGTLLFGLEQDSEGGAFESQEFFNGSFFDIRLFDDVRTPTEIVNNYDQTLANTEPGMFANWIFDNFSSDGVVTETVSGNNLTEQHFVGAGFTSSSPKLTLSIPEDASNGTAAGTLSAVDPDVGDTFTYTLSDDANGRFDINPGSGEITLIDSSQIDFEAAISHDITVRVTDSDGLTFDKTFTIDITNVNETPVAVVDNITAIEGVPYVAQLTLDDLLLNDSDPDGDTLTVNTTPVSGPSNGALVLNADGTFTYTANNNFNGVDAFTYEVQDGNGGSAQATVNITVQPRDIRILFTTQSDVNNSKVPGVSSWDAGEVLAIGDPNLQFEPAGSDGSVLPYFDLEAFSASDNMTINGLHFVSNDITVGGANSIDLQRGDLLFVSENSETMTSNNTLAINAGDVIIFRPTAVDDYSSGNFIHLLDQPGTAITTGITLIEQDVTIGDVTLTAGGFLFTQQSVVEESSIYYHPADDVGAGTTSGTVQTLISSVDIDVNFNNFVGVMVINEDLYLDGTMVPTGSIVTTLAGGDSSVGANGIEVNEDEIIYLTVTSTTMGSGTTVADATLLFDSGEIGLNNSNKKMNSLTILEEITPANIDPEITLAATALNYTEQDPPTVIDATASLVDPDSANFDTGVLRVELTAGGSSNDRLSINHQGTGAGQIGVSGNIVSYANVTIGSFSGGGSGSEPLVIIFNDNATVTAVQAVMRNITYENQSPNPSTAQRTATFTMTDGDGGSSTAVARNINISSVNDAPVLSGANDLATINEDAFTNGGTLVSDLVSGWIADTDAGALEGIAVVAVDDSNGSWQFTTDNGASWTAFGTVSTNDATLLAADADTRIRFVPDPGWNGTITNGITFHAWDQSIGANGDSVDLTLSGNVSDQFAAVSYANNDGSGVWTSSWLEAEDDGAAASGNVRIDSGKLRLDNLDGGTAESITRAADLSAAATATLTFDYDGYGAGGLDTVAFELSNDGGSSWTLLENVDIVGSDSGSKSYSLEGFTTLTAEMQLRIRIVQGFDGASEHINIDNVDIAYAGPGIGGSAAVSTATASSSISVTSVNNAPTMTMWYNEDWSTRKMLSIDATQVAGDVTDFPVLITFNTDVELAAQALANGDDIIFTAGDGGTLLAHEIEYFDETTGELRAWVKTDLSASLDTDIYMYFGNATATNQENAAGVWSSNYVGVYHLDESPTGTAGEIIDASGSGNHAVTEGGMDAADSVNTAIGQGLAFDGANDMIRISDSGSLDGLNDAATFSLWINWVDAADGDHQIVMASDNRFSGGDGYEWASQGDGDHFFYPDATSPDGNYNLGANPFTNNTWHHLAATMDYATKEVKIYIDGNEMSFSYEGVPSRWTDLSASGDLLFGGNPDRATRFFEGMMDEIRLADVVRSQEWILTEANNQANPGTFLSVGSSETVLTRDTLTDINEDDFNSPGDSVQSIISSSGSDRIMDDDDGAVEGIAVIAVDDTNGQWQYDANADGSWVAFGSVTDTGAILLDTDALIRFVPNADYNGPAGDLTFRAWDQTSGVNGNTGVDVSANGGSSAYSSETFGATLNVIPVNDAPVAVDDSITAIEDTPFTSAIDLDANDLDVEGDALSVVPGTFATTAGGSITIAADGSYTYTPAANFNGADSVNYTVTDGSLTDVGTLNITVTAINDAPVAVDDSITATEDTVFTSTIDLDANDTDIDGDALTVVPGTFATTAGGSITIAADGSYTYTPAANFNGADSVDYTVTDGALTDVGTLNITVTAVNDAPVAVDDSITATEDTVFTSTIDLDANDTDLDGDALTVVPGTFATTAGGSITIAADGSYTYTPAANFNGADSVDYTVTDGALTDVGTLNITVTAVNDAPVAVDDSITATEDTPFTSTIDLDANDTDIDGDALTVVPGTFATTAGGSITIAADGSYTYTPAANFNGADSVDYTVTDGALTDVGTLNITVTAVNDAPVAVDDSITAIEDTPFTSTIDLDANDTDLDGDVLSVVPGTFATTAGGSITIAADGSYTYTPAANFNGADSVNYTVTDGSLTDVGTLNITVTAVNDAPVAVDDSITATEDTPFTSTIDLDANDTDVDGDTLSVVPGTFATTAGGSITIAADGSYTYTPATNFNGADSVNYTVTDGSLTDVGTLNITVTAVNDAPVAVDDSITATEDTVFTSTIDLDANDTDLDGDALTVVPGTFATTAGGSITIAADGSYTYTPAANFNGADSVDYTVTDGALTDVGTLNITVTAVNDAPVAVDDSITATEDTPFTSTIDLDANDTDIDGDALTVVPGTFATTAGGSITIAADGSYTYTPAANFNGADSVDYTVTDGALTDVGTLNITVTAVNDAPVAVDDSITAIEDTPFTSTIDLDANDTDVDGDTLSVVPGTFATTAGGSITIAANGSYTYTPAANFNGADSVDYTVTDGSLTDVGTLNITVTAVNDAPVAVDDSITATEDTVFTSTIDLDANDTDLDGDALTVVPGTFATTAGGSITIAADGSYTYTPAANFNGADSVDYTVTDGALTDVGTLNITVTAVNDAPVAVDDSITATEDTPFTSTIDLDANDTDLDGDVLSVVPGTFATTAGGSITIAADGSYTYTPAANFNGADSVNYTVTDGALTDVGTLNITVTAVNDAPVAVDDSITATEDTPFTSTIDLDANDTDLDGDALSVVPGTFATTAGGSITIAGDGSYTYTPAANFNGADSVDYTVTDGALTDVGTLNITVTAVNDAPVAVDDSITATEDTPFTSTIDLDANDTDVDGDTLSVVPGTFATTAGGSITIAADGSYTYTPATNFNGADSVNYTVTDGSLTDVGTLNITVNPVNDAPVAVDDSITATEDTVFTSTIDLDANDTDLDGDALSVVPGTFATTAGGSITIAADGSYTYTPAANFNGADSVDYTVTDGALTDVGTLNITVTAVNDAPVAVDDSITATEDTPFTSTIDLDANDTDIDGDALTVVPGTFATTAGGSITIAADGSYTYTPAANFNGADSVDYTVTDGSLTDVGTLNITVTAVNDAPVAVDDSITATEDTPFTSTIDLDANDTDVDGDTLSVVPGTFATAAGGSITIAADGSYTYTPATNFSGADSVNYTVTDGALTDVGTLNITVTAVNDAPVAVDDSITAIEDTPFTSTIDLDANDTDVDGDTLSVVPGTFATTAGGSITIAANGSYTYTPAANFNGADSVDYTVTDGSLTDVGTLNITVTAVNDAPVAVDDSITATEDTPFTSTIDLDANDTDVDGDTLSVVPGTFATTAGGSITIAADGSYTYTPATNFNGADSVNYTVTDGSLTDVGTLNITVNPVNDAPVAVDDSITATEDTVFTSTIDLDANDTDLDGDALTVVPGTFATTAGGSITIAADGSYTYTPAANFNGADSVDYTVTDGALTDVGTLNITVTAVNDAPVAVDDSITATEDTPFSSTVDLDFNDTDLDGDTLSVVPGTFATSAGGSITIAADGSYTYTPAANFNGADSVDYTVTDGSLTDVGTLNITVNPLNDAPVAVDDSITAIEDTPFTSTIDLDANDTDLDGDALTVVPGTFATTAGGSITIAADGSGSYTYTPATNFNGADSVNYTVTDGALTDVGTLNITVTAVNDAPVAVDDSITATEDTPFNSTVDLDFNDTDLDGDALTVVPGTFATTAGGSITIAADGSYTYTPAASFNGADSVNYTVTDGSLTDVGTLNITVTAVNDAPVAVDDSINATEDTPFTSTIDLDANDTDLDGDALSVVPGTFATTAGGSITIAADGSYTYTPAANFNGADSVNYTVTDGMLTDVGTLNITVTAVNDAPVAVDDSITAIEDTPFNSTIDLDANDTDIDGDALTVVPGTFATTAGGSITIAADGSYTYTPAPNFNGADSVDYTVTDGSLSDVGTLNITVTAVNDAPVAVDDSITATEDTPFSSTVDLDFNDTDLDGDALTVVPGTFATTAGGSITIAADGSYTYTPAANFYGADSVDYTVTDGTLTDVGTLNITVTAVNDTPPVAVDDSITATEDTVFISTTDLDANDTDLDGDALTVVPGTFATTAGGSISIAADGSYTYTPAANFNGADSVDYTVTDGSFTDVGTLNITVNPVNDAPVAVDDNITVIEDTVFISTTDLDANDTDLEGDALTVVPGTFTTTAGGSITIAADGSYTYTPAANFNGADSVNYTVTDGALTDVGTLNITVNPVNDAPVLSSTAVTSATENAAYSYTITTSDVDIEAVTITAPTLPAWLTLVDNGDGTATLSGSPVDADVGSHNVVLNVSDGTLSSNQIFSITVSNINNAAVIGGIDTGLITEDRNVIGDEISVTGALTIADADAGESSFVAATVTGEFGSLIVDDAGNWVYRADNSGPAIQALQTGQTIADTLTVTTVDGTTHDVVITISGLSESAPPTVAEPPVVEPPPENEVPPPDEEPPPDIINYGEDSILPEITQLPGGTLLPSTEPRFDKINNSTDEEPAIKLARIESATPDQPGQVPMQARLQDIHSGNQGLDHLTLQVSDDAALNQQYELQLLERIQRMQDGMDNDTQRQNADDVEVQIIAASTASLTVGIVSWVLRGGSLLASLMGAVPLLSRFDLLPIVKLKDEEEGVESDDDDDHTQSQTKIRTRRVENMFSSKESVQQDHGSVNE